MKKILLSLLGIIAFSFSILSQIKYYTADQFSLIGKISDNTETRYERLPNYLKDKCRPPVWNLGKNTSGLAVRFRSNSTTISAKWEVLGNISMNHMTETGIKGLDLYAWEKNKWQFVNTARPTGKMNQQIIISNMLPKEREFLLYLPLYDGLTSLYIGVDSLSFIQSSNKKSPDTKNPIVVYGTSITQGGCTTRPGMSYTNILTRMLNKEIINLGFSGNGQLDYEIAELMATRHDASLFILDFIPNVNKIQIKDKTANFVSIIRKKNPKTPILFIESVIFPHSFFDGSMYEVITEKNRLLRDEYEKIKRSGDKYVYYLPSKNLIGNDGESTVDGIHLTDVGFLRFAKKLNRKIQTIIR